MSESEIQEKHKYMKNFIETFYPLDMDGNIKHGFLRALTFFIEAAKCFKNLDILLKYMQECKKQLERDVVFGTWFLLRLERFDKFLEAVEGQ